jgi:hypothetical protein
MIVNLYVDHLMSTPPASAEEVWNATKEHPLIFSTAAQRIGLSPKEYQEFRNALLDGKAVYVRLPRRLDAMSGDRRGTVYAVKNAMTTTSILGWRVTLADGAQVYVPQVCGNISLLRPAVVAHVKRPPTFRRTARRVPRVVTPVALTPPEQVVPVDVPAPAAQIVPASAAVSHGGGFLYGIPLIGGFLACVAAHCGSSPPNSPPPSCSSGSNGVGVCLQSTARR